MIHLFIIPTTQVDILKGQIKDKEKNRLSLRNIKIRRIVAEDRLRQQMDDCEQLQNKFNAVKIERDEFQTSMAGIRSGVSNKNNNGVNYLQRKFHEITQSVAKTGLQLNNLLVLCGIKEQESESDLFVCNDDQVQNRKSIIGQQKSIVMEISERFRENLEMFRKESNTTDFEDTTYSIPLQSTVKK